MDKNFVYLKKLVYVFEYLDFKMLHMYHSVQILIQILGDIFLYMVF